MTTEEATDLVLRELAWATKRHGSMASAHEGYAVILEELDELWEIVRLKEPDERRLAQEAAQIAAMGLRFLVDICGSVPMGMTTACETNGHDACSGIARPTALCRCACHAPGRAGKGEG